MNKGNFYAASIAIADHRPMAPVVQTLRVLIITLAAFLFSLTPARAAPITVDSTAQQGAGTALLCTLGAAIEAANTDAAVDACAPGSGDDTIILPAGTYTLTVAAGTGDLREPIGLPQVTSNIIVEGQGASTTFIERDPGAPDFRIFEQSGFLLGTLTIRQVTIRGGKSSLGGAIFAGGNGLIVEDAAFENNSATTGDGGAIHQGNPISPPVGGTVVTISGSTFSGNSAANLGGALFTQAFTSTIKNSTFSGNSAAGGGAIATAFDAVTVDFNNVTITDNHASNLGGGILDPNSLFGPSPTQFNFRNTILAGNTATVSSPECAAVLNSQGHNIVQQAAGCTIVGAAVGDLIGVDPLLGALANNGGGTKTHALLSGSPAIEAGDPGVPGSGGTACEATDQRGVARPIDGNLNGIAIYDIGAFEAIAIAPATLPGATVGVAYSQQLAASGGTPPFTFSVGIGSLPTGLALSSAGLISGTPTTAGAFTFSVVATDALVATGTAQYSVTIAVFVPSPPTIQNFAPPKGTVGTLVSINGANFTGATGVSFSGGVAATFIVATDTTITATVPLGALTGPISVTTPAGTATSAKTFEVKPKIDVFNPTSGLVGTAVTINGSSFTGTSGVTFAGTAASFVLVNDFTITATVPSGAKDGKIRVTTSVAFADSGSQFNVINPTITGFSPPKGTDGATVTINGDDLQSTTKVFFNGTDAGPLPLVSAKKVDAVVPPGATTGKITLTTVAGPIVSSKDFIVKPVITGFNPSSGPVGTQVTISGSGFTGVTSVTFKNTAAAFVLVNDFTITATVPSGATTGKISVTTADGTAHSNTAFTVT